MNRFYFILPLIFLCAIITAQNRTMELWPAHTFRFKLNKQFKIHTASIDYGTRTESKYETQYLKKYCKYFGVFAFSVIILSLAIESSPYDFILLAVYTIMG